MQTTSWVTPEGDVLKEESPLGWELVRESMEQALTTDVSRPALDLLSTTAVPIDRLLEDPPRLARLVWLVQGLDADELVVDRPWQTVLPRERIRRYRASPPDGQWVLVELRRPRLPQSSAQVPAAIARYQRPSPFVQSDDPRIQSRAREIIGRDVAPWRQAVALQAWVYQSLAKRFTVGLPSALDVLASLSGDCHEHTILYTALARSAGLPTRMVAGLVYYQGQLYYHAWPEVWVGDWIPTDPTLGQPLADATHFGLLEAENENLVALGKWIGRLRVSVLEME
jgi:transglutaminase-like putative cysteine protease